MRRKYIKIAVIVLAFMIIFPKIKAFFEGEKGRVKRVIYNAATAVEKEKPFKCISFISRAYLDDYGNNRRYLLTMARSVFDIYDDITVRIRKLEISVDKKAAQAKVEAICVARDAERKETNVFEVDTIELIIFFEKEKSGWKIIRMKSLTTKAALPPGVS